MKNQSRQDRSRSGKILFQASAGEEVVVTEADLLQQQTQQKLEKLGLGKGKLSAATKTAGVGFGGSVSIRSAIAQSNAKDEASKSECEAEEVEAPVEAAPVETTTETQSAAPQGQENATPSLTAADLQGFLETIRAEAATNAATQIAQAKEQAEQAIATAQAEVEKATQSAKESDERIKSLEGVFKLAGTAAPHNQRSDEGSGKKEWTPQSGTPNYLTYGLTKEPQGAIAHALALMEDKAACPAKVWVNPHNGDDYVHRDFGTVRSFYRSHTEEFKQSFEALLKGNGFLRGGTVQDAVAGYTSPASTSVPSNYLSILSMMMRETHSPKYIWWQFPVTINQPGFGPASNILIPRYSWLDEPSSEADYIGAEIDGTYFEVNSANQALVMTTVPALVKEYMLGRGTGVGNRPVAIPEFFSAYSLTSLEQALNTRLGHNYRGFEDMMCRKPYMSTIQVRYNNGNKVVSTPAQALTNGTMNHRFLNYLYAHLVGDLMIPPYEDGTINLVTHPMAIAQIKDGLDEKMAPPTADQIVTLTKMLQNDGNSEIIDRVQSYVGTVNGFNLFVSNSHSVGTPGSVGVQTEQLGVAGGSNPPRTTYSSWAFGRAAVGRGQGMEVEVRSEQSGTFGRSTRWIWVSHEGFIPIDVCPNGAIAATASQQLRVVEVRTTAEVVA